MEGELEKFHKQNNQLELHLADQRQKLRAADRELRNERQMVSKRWRHCLRQSCSDVIKFDFR